MSEFSSDWLHSNEYYNTFVDVIEVTGRISSPNLARFLFKRRHRSKENRHVDSEATVYHDLEDPMAQQLFWNYMSVCRPIVAVLTTPAADHIHENFSGNLSGSSLEQLPGEIALFQLQMGRHYVCESKAGSALYMTDL